MIKKRVSIIIVSYDSEKYIEKTLKSCLTQTYKNIEILLLDNNSQDKTVDIVKKIGRQDKRVKIFESTKNLGPYGGLNFLLEKARGKYIAIQDHDDIWFPEKIKKQVECLERNSDFIACGTNTFYFYEERKILILNKKAEITSFVDHTSLMFKNNNFRYNENYLLADEYFEKVILAEKGEIGCIQKGLTIHRIKKDGSNLSSNRFKFTIKNIKEFFIINKFKISTLMYVVDLLTNKYLPSRFIWFVRLNLTQKNNFKIKLKDFQLKNSFIDL